MYIRLVREMIKKAFEMTDMVKKFETATLTLQQKQGRFNRNPEEVFNVVAMLQRHGLNLGGNEN